MRKSVILGVNRRSSASVVAVKSSKAPTLTKNSLALVRVESRSYGIELKIPYRSSDDIVWRGTLGRKWFEASSGTVGHFGDVDLTFELI